VAGGLLLGVPAAQASPPGPNASRGLEVAVQGTVRVLPGENGEADQFWLEIDGGETVRLADGFEAEPNARFRGTVSVPGSGEVNQGSALGRAAVGGSRATVVEGTAQPVTAAKKKKYHKAVHRYVVRAKNLGKLNHPQKQVLNRLNQAQKYWIKQSGGKIKKWAKPKKVKTFRTTTTSVAAGCGLGGSDFYRFVQEAARKTYPKVNFSGRSPNHLVVLVPGKCSHSGVVGRAQLGDGFASGGPSVISSLESYPGATKFTAAHEWGHNFSMHHANTATHEYGDAYEVMGSVPGDTPILGAAYRQQQGILKGNQNVNVTGQSRTVALAKRSAAKGQRSASFVNPDNGTRCFIEYRDGGGGDARAEYSRNNNYRPNYYGGGHYRTGVTITCEDLDRWGYELQRASDANVYGLRAGNQWSNASGTYRVRVNSVGTTASVTTTSSPGSQLPAGTIKVVAKPALEETTFTASGFGATITGLRVDWLSPKGKVITSSYGGSFWAPLSVAGKKVRARTTVYAQGRRPVTVRSAAVKIPLARWFNGGPSSYAKVKGKAKVGRKVTAVPLNWVAFDARKPAGFKVRYQWLRNGKKIKGATKKTYKLRKADKGKWIQVVDRPRAPKFNKQAWTRSAGKRVR
jgi:hypothetical protein